MGLKVIIFVSAHHTRKNHPAQEGKNHPQISHKQRSFTEANRTHNLHAHCLVANLPYDPEVISS